MAGAGVGQCNPKHLKERTHTPVLELHIECNNLELTLLYLDAVTQHNTSETYLCYVYKWNFIE